MNLFKRLVCIVTALSMLLVLPAFAQNNGQSSVNTAYYEDLVSKLSAVNVWSLEKEASEAITRGEFAILLENLVNAKDEAVSEASFVDVDKAAAYYHAISYMKSNGIMNGIDAERFAPLRTITSSEAIKAIITILGYGDRAEMRGGYPTGYLNIALSLGFNPGSGELTAFEAAKMLDQAAFDVRLMTVIGYTTNETMAILGTNGDNTVLSQYHDIFKEEGKVTDNSLTREFYETEINIEDDIIKIDDEQFVYKKPDIRRALGSTIEFYYKDANGIKTLLWWEYRYASRQEITINADDLITESKDYSKTLLVYRDGNNTKRVKLNPRASFIYNEIAYPTFTVADLKPEEGWFTIVDEDGDNVYDVIFAEAYENYFVVSESNDGTIFSDCFSRSIDTGKFDIVELFDAEGTLLDEPYDDIYIQKELLSPSREAYAPARLVKANTVISVFPSMTDENGEGRYLKIILSDKTVIDIYNAVVTDEEKSICTIGKNDYEMNKFLASKINSDNTLTELKMGEKYRFYLDYRGQITYYEALSAIDRYAYLLASGSDSLGLNPGAEMKVVLDDGTMAVLPLKDKVLFNGVKVDEASVIADADIAAANLLIRIKSNSKGEITEVNTAPKLCTTELYKNVGYDPTKFTMVMNSTDSTYYSNGRSMVSGTGGPYAISADTIIFKLPDNGNEDEIIVFNGTEAEKRMKNAGRFNLRVYDADNVHTAKAMVMWAKDDTANYDYGAYYSYCYIVTDVKGTTNRNGENVKQIRTWCYDYEYNLVENEPGILPLDVKAGDIMRLQVDDNERITKAVRVISTTGATRPEPFMYTKTDKTQANAANTHEVIAYGYPVGRNNYGITISTGSDGNQIDFIPFYTPGIVYFNVENMDCSVAARTAIPVFATLDEEKGKFIINNKDVAVLVTTSSSGMYDCIIIQY